MSSPGSTTHGAITTTPPDESSVERDLRRRAELHRLRLQTSRRVTDQCSGPTLYWLFDGSTRRLLSAKSGWSLDDVQRYLSHVPVQSRTSAQ